MTAPKNIGVVEGRVRLVGGGLLVVLGFSLGGWGGWVTGIFGLALVLTSAVRY
ncbi:MAG: YgaP-like transmembrane domain [Candidatus Methylomirabilia bacterium]